MAGAGADGAAADTDTEVGTAIAAGTAAEEDTVTAAIVRTRYAAVMPAGHADMREPEAATPARGVVMRVAPEADMAAVAMPVADMAADTGNFRSF
jgi:hypothetical protein